MTGKKAEALAVARKLHRFAIELNDSAYVDIAQSTNARMELLNGDIDSAIHWARTPAEKIDLISMLIWLESPNITRCRILIAHGAESSLEMAASLLDEIQTGAEEYHLACHYIEILVLKSLLLEQQGAGHAALAVLEQALEMAKPGRWIRSFVEPGKPMIRLLEQYEYENGSSDTLRCIWKAFKLVEIARSGTTQEPKTLESKGIDLVEPLTNREIQILNLLARRLRNKEIATQLFVSTETVKTHLKHLYQKLGVSNRQQAAALLSRCPELSCESLAHDQANPA